MTCSVNPNLLFNFISCPLFPIIQTTEDKLMLNPIFISFQSNNSYSTCWFNFMVPEPAGLLNQGTMHMHVLAFGVLEICGHSHFFLCMRSIWFSNLIVTYFICSEIWFLVERIKVCSGSKHSAALIAGVAVRPQRLSLAQLFDSAGAQNSFKGWSGLLTESSVCVIMVNSSSWQAH